MSFEQRIILLESRLSALATELQECAEESGCSDYSTAANQIEAAQALVVGALEVLGWEIG